MSKIFSRGFIVALLVFITITSAPSVVGESVANTRLINGKVDQGEQIILTNIFDNTSFRCTVGYISHEESRVYTAGHCGEVGYIATIPEEDDLLVGSFQTEYNTITMRNDYGWINVDPKILGENIYTGDTHGEANNGDTICSYGAKSQQIHCGIVRGYDGEVILSGAGGIKGDSGGPAWIPGEGFIAVYSMYWYNYEDDELVSTAFSPINSYDKKETVPDYMDEDPAMIPETTFIEKILGTIKF